MKRKAIKVISSFLVMLAMAACEQAEDVVPLQPATDSTATVIVPDTSTVVVVPDTSTNVIVPDTSTNVVVPDTSLVTTPPPAPEFDSALYRYGKSQHLPYRILLPRNYDSTKDYPMLIFLHGIGESGTDNEKQLLWGASLFQADSIRNNYPAFIIFPQCPSSHYWFDNWGIKSLNTLVQELVATYRVDMKKLYIGGLSMGAYGTYAMVSENPGTFAAAIAISGDGNVKKAHAMAKTKWRIFAGKKDEVVSSGKSEKMAKALAKAGASVLFKVYPEANHKESWVNAFAEPDFCSWLFSISNEGSKH